MLISSIKPADFWYPAHHSQVSGVRFGPFSCIKLQAWVWLFSCHLLKMISFLYLRDTCIHACFQFSRTTQQPLLGEIKLKYSFRSCAWFKSQIWKYQSGSVDRVPVSVLCLCSRNTFVVRTLVFPLSVSTWYNKNKLIFYVIYVPSMRPTNFATCFNVLIFWKFFEYWLMDLKQMHIHFIEKPPVSILIFFIAEKTVCAAVMETSLQNLTYFRIFLKWHCSTLCYETYHTSLSPSNYITMFLNDSVFWKC